YPEFQESLRLEVQARLSSPLARYRDEPKQDSAVNHSFDVSTHNLKATLELLSDRDVKEAVEVLADVRRRVMVLGGRVSAPLARVSLRAPSARDERRDGRALRLAGGGDGGRRGAGHRGAGQVGLARRSADAEPRAAAGGRRAGRE